VLSYLVLRGRCGGCKTTISPRYPLVELVTSGLFALCAWRYGITPQGALWAAFGALLVCQFLIDFDTQYLPDSLNYPLLWLGLIGAAMGWTGVSVSSAVWGAVFGYLSLWLMCTMPFAWSRARKAWAMETSNCWPRWVPGSAPTTSSRSSSCRRWWAP
jgi:leader peptidase (prepilin peptidase)/N-methyltransferase